MCCDALGGVAPTDEPQVSYLKGALQLLIYRYGQNRFAQVPERVSTESFVVLIIGNSKSFHLGAQGTFKCVCMYVCMYTSIYIDVDRQIDR